MALPSLFHCHAMDWCTELDAKTISMPKFRFTLMLPEIVRYHGIRYIIVEPVIYFPHNWVQRSIMNLSIGCCHPLLSKLLKKGKSRSFQTFWTKPMCCPWETTPNNYGSTTGFQQTLWRDTDQKAILTPPKTALYWSSPSGSDRIMAIINCVRRHWVTSCRQSEKNWQ